MWDAAPTSLTPSGPLASARSTAKARRMLWTPIVGLDMGPSAGYRDGSAFHYTASFHDAEPTRSRTASPEAGWMAPDAGPDNQGEAFDLSALADDELVEQMH